MKTTWRTVRSDEPSEISVGMFLGLSLLAIGPLAAGVAMLSIRHASLRDMQAAKSWVETPCLIERCEFVSHDDDRSLEIVYGYEVDGREYRSDRLDPIVGRMGDDDVFERFVHESYPPGARLIRSTVRCVVGRSDRRGPHN